MHFFLISWYFFLNIAHWFNTYFALNTNGFFVSDICNNAKNNTSNILYWYYQHIIKGFIYILHWVLTYITSYYILKILFFTRLVYVTLHALPMLNVSTIQHCGIICHISLIVLLITKNVIINTYSYVW